MPTEAEIRKLVKPIAARRSDIIYVNRYLLSVPMRSVFAALLFERSGDKFLLNPLRVCYALCTLDDFPGSDEFPFRRPGTKTWGDVYGYDYPYMRDRLHEIRPENWLTNDPDYPDAARIAIEAEMLPNVLELNDLAAAEAFNNTPVKPSGEPPWSSIPFRLAAGDFEWIRENIGLTRSRIWSVPKVRWYCGDLAERVLDHGNGITTAERRAIFAHMHEREAQAVRNMKLEKHWIPTPFPAEERLV